MRKQYLKSLDKVYCAGVYLRWDGNEFFIDQLEDTIYFDGLPVNFDENHEPYIEIELENQNDNTRTR